MRAGAEAVVGAAEGAGVAGTPHAIGGVLGARPPRRPAGGGRRGSYSPRPSPRHYFLADKRLGCHSERAQRFLFFGARAYSPMYSQLVSYIRGPYAPAAAAAAFRTATPPGPASGPGAPSAAASAVASEAFRSLTQVA